MDSKRQAIHEKSEKIVQLKGLLHNSDYQAIKYAEGELTEEEYAPIREQRKAWRAEINILEIAILVLRAE